MTFLLCRAPARMSLLLAMGLLAPAAARADDWGSLGLDGPRSRASAERSGALFGPARWEHHLPPLAEPVYRALLASPAVADGVLVFGTQSNVVRGVREQDGRLLWELRVPDSIYATPALWRGWAYVVGMDRKLRAIRVSDGSVVWQRELGGMAYASATVADGSVFVSSGDPVARVYRFDAETGKLVWQAGEGILEQAAYAPAAIAEGHVIVAEVRGRYHSFALADGRLEWTVRIGGTVNMASPVILNGRVYLVPGGGDGQLHALDLTTGRPIEGWPVALPDRPAPAAGSRLLGRNHVVSSLAGLAGYLVVDRRIEDRLDQNGDGQTDAIVLEETVLALDTEDGHLLWSQANGRLTTPDPTRVPSYGVCPTPAIYQGNTGETLVAVASTLTPRLRVLDLASGVERWGTDLSAPTRGSPVMANGRLVIGTEAGTIHSFASRANGAPGAPAPLAPVDGRDAEASSVVLRWTAALDPEGESAVHEVRVDDDGEVLHDWDLAVATTAGQQTLALAVALAPGRTYTFAIRARDSKGAFSPWSAPGQFRAVGAPSVQLDGLPAAGLTAALAQARAGSVVTLGAGTFPLSSTLRLPAGVSLVGAGPHLTVLSGKGLAVAVEAGAGNGLRQLTVAGAAIGVDVTSGEDAHLENAILRDNSDAGLRVSTGAGVELVSATVARNGAGVQARGRALVRNTIITGNDVGIDAEGATLTSRYNDVVANRTADYRGTARSDTDRADAVTFGGADDDLRLMKPQATTDQGDPADDYANEPAPNGDRINLGAFGNTAFAELSDPSPPPPPPPPPPAAGELPSPPKGRSGGGACSLAPSAGEVAGGPMLFVLGAAALLVRRRRQARTPTGRPLAPTDHGASG